MSLVVITTKQLPDTVHFVINTGYKLMKQEVRVEILMEKDNSNDKKNEFLPIIQIYEERMHG